MSEQNKALVRDLFEGPDRNNGKLPEEIFTPDFVAHVPGFPPMDLKTLQQQLDVFYDAFSDWSRTFEDMVVEGDRVAVRIMNQMTHTGNFMGLPPSGKQIKFMSIGIARITGDKIAEWWNAPDRLGLLQQVGLVPEQQLRQ